MLKSFLHPLKALFYPQNCPICDNILQSDEAFICLTCETQLPALPYTIFDKNPIEKLFYNNVPINGCNGLSKFC